MCKVPCIKSATVYPRTGGVQRVRGRGCFEAAAILHHSTCVPCCHVSLVCLSCFDLLLPLAFTNSLVNLPIAHLSCRLLCDPSTPRTLSSTAALPLLFSSFIYFPLRFVAHAQAMHLAHLASSVSLTPPAPAYPPSPSPPTPSGSLRREPTTGHSLHLSSS